jgi:hypothetical protein
MSASRQITIRLFATSMLQTRKSYNKAKTPAKSISLFESISLDPFKSWCMRGDAALEKNLSSHVAGCFADKLETLAPTVSDARLQCNSLFPNPFSPC